MKIKTKTEIPSKLEVLIQNKWYKFSKYLVAGALIISAVLALVAGWFAGTDSSASSILVTTDTIKSFQVALIVLGFASLVLAVVILATQTKPRLSVAVTSLGAAMIILLLVLSGIAIDGTYLYPVQ